MGPYRPPQQRADADGAENGKIQDVNQDVRYCDDVRYSGGDVRMEKRGQAKTDGWHGRQDGRRPELSDNFSELEIFGEKKTRGGGIDFDQYDKIPVEVTGDGAGDFTPMSSFGEFDLAEQLSWNLNRCGYDRPTPVQKHAIPIVVGGRDLMACAQTGSGKTCAFMVPCIQSLLLSGPPSAPQGGRSRRSPMPCALVLAPTRELAAQIHEEALKFAYNTGVQVRIVYGGADMREQLREMGKGTDILVATPGRLTDFIGKESVDMGVTQFLILDEADRMLDMGFEPQVREIVQNSGLGRNVPRRRQNMMFSATFAGSIQKMAGDFMVDYLFITVGRVGSCSETITQTLHYAEDGKGKTRALEKIYRENAPPMGQLTVIFVETKRRADEIEVDLWQAGLRVCAIHGDRDQRQREIALEAFKSGENPILVATDVAARGLDISNVGLVINYDMPKQMDDYVHRIGRTGRAGKRGTAIGFVNEKCRYCNELAELLKQAKQEVPSWLSQLARENSDNYAASKGKGKGKGGYAPNFGSKDIREVTKAAAAAAEVAKAPEPPKEPVRPKSPPREVPDAWDDSDED